MMWRSNSAMSELAHDLSYLNLILRQQLEDMLAFINHQKKMKQIPRIETVRFMRPSIRSDYCVTVEMNIVKKENTSQGSSQKIELAFRIPNSFPSRPPLVACTSGGEHLPSTLISDGQLKITSSQKQWSDGITMTKLVQEICTALQPTLHILDLDKVHVMKPSAPTYYPEVHAKEITLHCKWKNIVKIFTIQPQISFVTLLRFVKDQFKIPASCSIRLVEIESSQDGHLVVDDKHLAAILSVSNNVRLQIEECPDKTSSVDLLGLEASLSASCVQSVPPVSEKLNSASLLQGVREIKANEFQVQSCIGAGSSCRVYKANWRGTDIAVKTFTGMDPALVDEEFKNEVQMMTHLGCHPNIVLLLAICHTPRSIVFEFLPYSLFEIINGSEDPRKRIPAFPTSWTKRVTMMLDIAKGLQFLHSFDIVHRDLKSLNLLVTHEGRVKLADFGISRIAQQNGMMTGTCGTFQWMAPEVILNEKYSVSADIYSFGVVMWEICEASAPFADIPPASIPIAVVKENKRPKLSSGLPDPLKRLIVQCWQEDPSQRPSAAQVVETLTGFFPQ